VGHPTGAREGKFNEDTLTAVLRRLKRVAGVKGRANAHSFRHAFARDTLLAGADLAWLAQVLGHRELSTTMMYSTLATNDLQAKHRSLSPLAARIN